MAGKVPAVPVTNVLGYCVLGDRCRVNDDAAVTLGEPFDMWRESWTPRIWDDPGVRLVLAHRECNDRADHSKDGPT